MYVPAVPAMRERFSLSSGEVGLALPVHFAGALLGVLCTRRLRRVGNRLFLVAALTTIAVGCLGSQRPRFGPSRWRRPSWRESASVGSTWA